MKGVVVITIDEVDVMIRERVRGKLPSDVAIDSDTVLKDVGLSSLQFADIVFALEERHDVEFDGSKMADVKTLGELLDVANQEIASSKGGDQANLAQDAAGAEGAEQYGRA